MLEYRGFRIKNSPKSPNLLEVGVGAVGGTIPNYLGSLFTNINEAKAAIDRYLTPKPKKGAASGNQEKATV